MKRPQLAHVGIFARDVDALVTFYCDVFDMHVTDHGVTVGVRVAFLSADPAHHHQLVIAGGRGGDQKSTLAQLSFCCRISTACATCLPGSRSAA